MKSQVARLIFLNGFISSMTHGFSPQDIRIEKATILNAAAILRLIKAYYRFDRIRFDHEAIASGLSMVLNDPSTGQAWLILNRRRPVGYLILTFGFDLEFRGRQATLTDLYIEARHRRKGIGRRAMMHVEAFCRSCSVKALELQVTGKNKQALEFYQSLGFEAHERIPMSKRISSRDAGPQKGQ